MLKVSNNKKFHIDSGDLWSILFYLDQFFKTSRPIMSFSNFSPCVQPVVVSVFFSTRESLVDAPAHEPK